jgi:hypothetical protein
MVLYTCERCTREFKKKSQYEYHINRKYKCEIHQNEHIATNESQDNITLNLILKELQNVKKELTDVKNDNKQMKSDNKKIKNELKTVKKERNAMIKYSNVVNNGTIIDNKGTINNNTVNIVAFGKENMDFVIGEIGKLCQGNKTISNFIDFVHFNKDKPENHNVYMPNRKNKNEVFVHNGVKWMLADKKNVVEHLIDQQCLQCDSTN